MEKREVRKRNTQSGGKRTKEKDFAFIRHYPLSQREKMNDELKKTQMVRE